MRPQIRLTSDNPATNATAYAGRPLQEVADPLTCLDRIGVVLYIHFFPLQRTHQTRAETVLHRTPNPGQADPCLLLLELLHLTAGQLLDARIAGMDRGRSVPRQRLLQRRGGQLFC